MSLLVKIILLWLALIIFGVIAFDRCYWPRGEDRNDGENYSGR